MKTINIMFFSGTALAAIGAGIINGIGAGFAVAGILILTYLILTAPLHLK